MRALLTVGCLASSIGCAELTPVTSVRDVHDTRAAKTGSTVAGVVAGVGGLTAAGFAIGGVMNNSAIEDGGYATGADIKDASDRGQTFNQVAYTSASIALIALGVSFALYHYATK